MQTSVWPDALPSAPPLPAEHGADEKLASGLQSSQFEANIWETQTLTSQMRWGNDDMHARYYNPNLGRFLSVDPVGGEVGSSESWNRYSYVGNNPILWLDPNGEADVPSVLIELQSTLEHFEAANERFQETIVFKPALRLGVGGKVKVGPFAAEGALQGRVEEQGAGRRDLAGVVEAVGGIKAPGTPIDVGVNFSTSLQLTEDGRLLPNGLELKGNGTIGSMGVDDNGVVSVTPKAGVVQVELGVDLGSFAKGLGEALTGVAEAAGILSGNVRTALSVIYRRPTPADEHASGP